MTFFDENLMSFYKVKHLFKGYIIIPKFLCLISLYLCMCVLLKKLNTSLSSSQGPISTSSHPHILQSGWFSFLSKSLDILVCVCVCLMKNGSSEGDKKAFFFEECPFLVEVGHLLWIYSSVLRGEFNTGKYGKAKLQIHKHPGSLAMDYRTDLSERSLWTA